MSSVPRLHVIASEAETEGTGFLDAARRMLEACGAGLALHLRLPESSDRRVLELAEPVALAAAAVGGWCVVNGRPDIALAAGAQAAQLGHRALPPAAARRVVGGRIALGASVHGVGEALEAVRDGANYLLLGTIFATPSHPGREASGPVLVRRVRAALEDAGAGGTPVVAIGGIDLGRATAVRDAGADGIAVRRAVWAREDPVAAARGLLAVMAGPSPGRR